MEEFEEIIELSAIDGVLSKEDIAGALIGANNAHVPDDASNTSGLNWLFDQIETAQQEMKTGAAYMPTPPIINNYISNPVDKPEDIQSGSPEMKEMLQKFENSSFKLLGSPPKM